MKFYASGAKELKLKLRKFWVLIHTFVEVEAYLLVPYPFEVLEFAFFMHPWENNALCTFIGYINVIPQIINDLLAMPKSTDE